MNSSVFIIVLLSLALVACVEAWTRTYFEMGLTKQLGLGLLILNVCSYLAGSLINNMMMAPIFAAGINTGVASVGFLCWSLKQG